MIVPMAMNESKFAPQHDLSHFEKRHSSSSTGSMSASARVIPLFESGAVRVHELLGSGGFCSVYNVSLESFSSHDFGKRQEDDDGDECDQTQRQSEHEGSHTSLSSSLVEGVELVEAALTARHHQSMPELYHPHDHASVSSSASSLASSTRSLWSTNTTDRHWALKRLKSEIQLVPEREAMATRDLMREARILSDLPREHPHIIRLHGLSADFWSNNNNEENDSVAPAKYLLLERLEQTLDKRLKQWSQSVKGRRRRLRILGGGDHSGDATRERLLPNGLRLLGGSGGDQYSSEAVKERLLQSGLYGIAQALGFLHENGVMFRDVKPANIGYTEEHAPSSVRLFDFGLARAVPRDDEPSFALTCAGTLRYMAPEVIDPNGCYNEKVDVYSFGLVLWEVCMLERPYGKPSSPEQLEGWITTGKHKPTLQHGSRALRKLVDACLQHNPRLRPSVPYILDQLEDEQLFF